MKRTVAVAAVFCLISLGSSGAGDIREKTAYFMVRGSTLAELDRDLARRGPLVSQTGLRHPGATEVSFDGKVTYKAGRRSCSVDRADLELQLVMTVPKWRTPASASSETRLVWKTLQEDIVRHERQHATIAKTWMKKMEGAIRNLRPEANCDAMERRVNATSQRFLAQHERAQMKFDMAEGRGITKRLQLALRRNAREAAAR